jgi:hypothetical protein
MQSLRKRKELRRKEGREGLFENNYLIAYSTLGLFAEHL